MVTTVNGTQGVDNIQDNVITTSNLQNGAVHDVDIDSLSSSKLVGALPAISGANLTDLPGGGKILQVVNKLISTQGSQTIGTTDTQIGTGTDFDISITPQGAGSKFVVSAKWFGEGANTWDIVFNIQRDGVRINTDGATASNRLGLSMATQTYGSAANSSSTPEIMYVQTVDSTGSTSGTAITYTLVAASNANRTLWTNRCFATTHETGISELMIMEVAQ